MVTWAWTTACALPSSSRERHRAREGAADQPHVALCHPEGVADVAGVVMVDVAQLGMRERPLTAWTESDVVLGDQERIADVHDAVAIHVAAERGPRRRGGRARGRRG